jgi:rod shape-determining protein MreD
MKVWVIAGILLGNIIIQSALFPFITIYGVKPDSLIVLVVSFALLAGNPIGAVTGFFGGLLQDILYGQALGFYALQYMLIGYFVGMVHGKVFVDGVLVPVFFVGVAIVFQELFMLIRVYFMRLNIPIHNILLSVVLPEALYTILITPLIYYYISKLYKYRFMSKPWYFD